MFKTRVLLLSGHASYLLPNVPPIAFTAVYICAFHQTVRTRTTHDFPSSE